MTYGYDVYKFYSLPPEELLLDDARNPMCEAFPRVTTFIKDHKVSLKICQVASCTYYQYGSGGRQVSLNALCILGLNIIMDKVYLVLWYWYIFLIICGIARIIIRLILTPHTYNVQEKSNRYIFRACQVSQKFRFQQMELRMHRYFKTDENIVRVKEYLAECSVGDW